jgi:hypothetical protein
MKMMTRDDIQLEFGWNDSMIHSLLQNPDSTNARRNKHTGGYTYRQSPMLSRQRLLNGRGGSGCWPVGANRI